jgi:3-dehydroquinate dehydratase/shikimate dehydrogenase
MSHLCFAIFVHEIAQAKRDIILAVEAGADMVELRCDLLPNVEQIQQILRWIGIPCIVTCRSPSEGGQCELSEEDRVHFLDQMLHVEKIHVDVELRTLQKYPFLIDDVASQLIVSAHDFEGRPDRLYNLLTEMNALPANVNKMVWMARSVRDNLEAFELLRSKSKPMIALCMGETGLISRVLAKKFGGFLTYASLPNDAGTAPGQISIQDMKRLYRWDAIGEKTKVYGVVASPVAHSMSPAIHNAAFDQTGEDGVYLPMLVQPGYESFKAFMETFTNFKPLDLGGLSVTIPHKENALKYLQEKGAQIEPLAIDIGAVNTIIIDRDKNGEPILRGSNTDYHAIIDTICDALKIRPQQLTDYRVAIIGAGGTGRTAVAALAKLGATVVVYNRTQERADALAAEFDGREGKVVSARWEKLCDSCCQIYINTTSVGMHPKMDESPLGDRQPQFTAETLVFDTIYNPLQTKLLKQAADAGAKTVGGIEMFVRQAAAQFTDWTGKSAPMVMMRDVIEQRLRNDKVKG